MSRGKRSHSRTMKEFWNSKARENSRFYIATWLGYREAKASAFFESADAIRAMLREHGYEPRGGRMLEIGCGIGRMTRGFAGVFDEVDAIDVSSEMIAQARESLADQPNVRVQESNGVDLALFPDGVFDLCFSFIVFQHVPDFGIVRNYILEASRTLKAGGAFLFQVNNLTPPPPYRWWLLRMLSQLWRRVGRHALLEVRARLSRGPRGFDHPAWIGHTVSLPELRAALGDAGLECRRMTGVGTQYLWVLAGKPKAG